MVSNLLAMASNLIAMASNLAAMASNLIAIGVSFHDIISMLYNVTVMLSHSIYITPFWLATVQSLCTDVVPALHQVLELKHSMRNA